MILKLSQNGISFKFKSQWYKNQSCDNILSMFLNSQYYSAKLTFHMIFLKPLIYEQIEYLYSSKCLSEPFIIPVN